MYEIHEIAVEMYFTSFNYKGQSKKEMKSSTYLLGGGWLKGQYRHDQQGMESQC